GASRGTLPRRLPRCSGVLSPAHPGGAVEFGGRRAARVRLRRRGDGAGVAGYPVTMAAKSGNKLPTRGRQCACLHGLCRRGVGVGALSLWLPAFPAAARSVVVLARLRRLGVPRGFLPLAEICRRAAPPTPVGRL